MKRKRPAAFYVTSQSFFAKSFVPPAAAIAYHNSHIPVNLEQLSTYLLDMYL